ncbi:MAG: helix-turn-helix domain-containing protein [Phycisphaerae bacterium]
MNAPSFPFHRPDSLEALGAAIRNQREHLGLTLDQLAAKTAISKPYLSNIETARAPGPPSEEKLRKIAHALNIDEQTLLAAGDWLRTPDSVRRLILHSDATPRRPDGTRNLDAAFPPSPPGMARNKNASAPAPGAPLPLRDIPLLNRVAAGGPREHGDLNYPAGIADDYIPVPDLPTAPVKSAFALRISGDSMAPDYTEGEIIIVGPGDATDGDDCVVRLAESENFATTFKRLFFERNTDNDITAIHLVPLNPAHRERRLAPEEITGIYPLMYRLTPAKHTKPATPEPAAPPPNETPRDFTSRVSIEHV